MIEFRIDPKGVAPYQQIAQQVKTALRLGILKVGDQLPTVKEVVGSIAINPNTVLKAYRELEREGYVRGRPGVGTFVLKGFDGPDPNSHPALRRALQRWLSNASDAGFDREGVIALFESALSDLVREEIA